MPIDAISRHWWDFCAVCAILSEVLGDIVKMISLTGHYTERVDRRMRVL